MVLQATSQSRTENSLLSGVSHTALASRTHNTTYMAEYPAKFAVKFATPKSARLKFEQPLNCGFVTGLQKPYKPLCGRRCRPLCPARGKQGNPSLSPACFRTSRKTALKPPISRVCGQIRRVFSRLPDADFLRAAVSAVARNTALMLPQSGGLYSANFRCAFLLFG